ncbi:hypothetical protein AAVH_20934, partial [Aphelenchoides avenae]
MIDEDEKLLDYEEHQEDLVQKGLAPETVSTATSQLANVSLNSKPAEKEIVMKDSTAP